MKKLLLLATCLILTSFASAWAQGVPAFGQGDPTPAKTDLKRYVISDLGAVGDGKTVNTQAIQAAIDQCAAAGGGVLVVPKGTFLSGALYFKQGVNLLVEKDGILKSTSTMADFRPIYTRWEGIERYWTSAFLNFISMTNVEVSGEGTIDGSGQDFGGGGRGRGAPGGAGGPGGAAVAGGARGGFNPAAGTGLTADQLTTINNAFRKLLSTDDGAKAVLDKYPDQILITGGSAAPAGGAGRGGLGRNGPQVAGPTPKVEDVYTMPLPTTASLNFAPDPTKLPVINAAGVRLPGGGVAPPRALVFQNCQNVRLSGLHLLNEARWGFVFIYCQNVTAEKLSAYTDTRIPSSDGMDVDSCKNVLISQCGFDDGDDDISIKSGKDEDGRRVNIPCEDIVIQSCRFGRGDGGAAMGSETSGGIRNVIVRDCVADSQNAAPVRIKTNVTRGGVIENITYENITYKDVQRAYEINLAWTATSSAGPRMPPVLRNVKIINCSGVANSAGIISGLPDSLVSNLTFENCHVTTRTGLTIGDVTDEVKASAQGPGLKIDSANGIPIIWRTAEGPPTGAEISGAAAPAAATAQQ
jgi:hypothetical protein